MYDREIRDHKKLKYNFSYFRASDSDLILVSIIYFILQLLFSTIRLLGNTKYLGYI